MDRNPHDRDDDARAPHPLVPEEYEGELSFWLQLGQAVGYPLKRNGRRMLLAVSLAVAAISAMWTRAAPLATFLSAVGVAYLAVYFFHTIGQSARGEHDPPAWVGLQAMRDNAGAIVPMFIGLGLYGVLVPMGFAAGVGEALGVGANLLAWQLLFVIGLSLLPMATLAVAWFRSPEGLHPLLILVAIARVPGPYLATCSLIALVAAGLVLAVAGSPSEMTAIRWALAAVLGSGTFYLLLVAARALGLIYFCYDDRLGWDKPFGEKLARALRRSLGRDSSITTGRSGIAGTSDDGE